MPARIVVVHDEPSFLDPLVTSLKTDGHDVAGFNNPLAAWDALGRSGKAELLVTRVQFGPGKSHGFALARWARHNRRHIQILFVARQEFESEADGLGVFLPLPASVPQVAEAIVRLLSTGSGDAQKAQ